jgi:hypothetical protein
MNIDDYLPVSDASTSPAAISPSVAAGRASDAAYARERAEDRERQKRRSTRDDGTAELKAFRARWAANIDKGAQAFRDAVQWLAALDDLRREYGEIETKIELAGGRVGSGISDHRAHEAIACALGGGNDVELLAGESFAESSTRASIQTLEEAIEKVKAALARHAREPAAIRTSAENIWNA